MSNASTSEPSVFTHSMSNPTNKQLVISSLKALHKAKTRVLFKIKGLRRQRKDIRSVEREALGELARIKSKMEWEIRTNGAALKDKS